MAGRGARLIHHSELRISLVPRRRRFILRGGGTVPTDVDRTASARNWTDVQPIRGAKHALSAAQEWPESRPTRDTRPALAGKALVLQSTS